MKKGINKENYNERRKLAIVICSLVTVLITVLAIIESSANREREKLQTPAINADSSAVEAQSDIPEEEAGSEPAEAVVVPGEAESPTDYVTINGMLLAQMCSDWIYPVCF